MPSLWGFTIGRGDSGTCWAAVRKARLSPSLDRIRTRVLCGELFVDVDPQAWLVIRVHVAVADPWSAGEHRVDELAEAAPFLDAKVRCPEVNVQVGGVPDG
jgi:hypothetical protein